jgi:hypothetical protein
MGARILRGVLIAGKVAEIVLAASIVVEVCQKIRSKLAKKAEEQAQPEPAVPNV